MYVGDAGYACIYGNQLDAYTWQNNYLNNSEPQIGRACQFHTYTGARQAFMHAKIII